MPLIIGLMLVKNEADILPKTLDAFASWLDGLVVIDNGSKDGSLEILRNHPIVKKLAVDATEFDESYLMPKLIELAKDLNADWYVECDADEVFDPAFRKVLEDAHPDYNTVTAHIRYMTDENHFYRQNSNFCRAYRNKNFDFSSIKKLHRGKIPIPTHKRNRLHSGLYIKHFHIRGYEQGMRKYFNYIALDPDNKYQHTYEDIRRVAEMWERQDFRGLFLKKCN